MTDLPTNFLKQMKRIFLLFTLLCMLATTLPSRAETLTVYDGTATNGYVPIYGAWASLNLKC